MPFPKSRLLFASVLLATAAAAALSSGCFSSAKKKRAEEKSIPLAVEQALKDRWTEKRSTELVQQGLSPYAAQRQAESEFSKKYSYTQVAQ
ncbi:hypothetical protein AXK12_06315 [Cephaloticoccus capnophilus]|uniref:Uncharacterized protein n=1 Tax=Cephaloticoccus capnophilus TaxID=1548208 RepID=A0A139SJU9_9BACT|nr:hypothetical protein [Cephaloticoccus capnophilus]KXU34852.1 hypothetical protein AXK12_06315 [Cephaloticoccus capnophilus]